MRGIILAGGTGSRLGPLTKTINKHVLPVGALPMIFYPLMTLRNSGIHDITVVSTPSGVGQIANLLGSGRDHGCAVEYRVQDHAGGIAQALGCAYRGGKDLEALAVILGDNVFAHAPTLDSKEQKATCFLKQIDDREQLKAFGVPRFDAGKITGVVEKPAHPPSSFAVTGLYTFGAGVWDALKPLREGARGEVEMTDLLDLYAKAGLLDYREVRGFWGDAGTPEGMRECAEQVRAKP